MKKVIAICVFGVSLAVHVAGEASILQNGTESFVGKNTNVLSESLADVAAAIQPKNTESFVEETIRILKEDRQKNDEILSKEYPLHYAVRERNIFEIGRLLSGYKTQGDDFVYAEVNKLSHLGMVPLQYAMGGQKNINLGIAEVLISNGAIVDPQTPGKMSPLTYAVNAENFQAVERLLEYGANMNAHEEQSMGGFEPKFSRTFESPVKMALDVHNKEILQLLIDHGASVAQRGYVSGIVANGWLDMLKDLIDAKRIDAKTEGCLHDAARGGHIDAVKILLENGALVNLQDEYLETPLHEAVRGNHLKMVQFLVENKANILIVNEFNESPISLVRNKITNGYADDAYSAKSIDFWKKSGDEKLLELSKQEKVEIERRQDERPEQFAILKYLNSIREMYLQNFITSTLERLRDRKDDDSIRFLNSLTEIGRLSPPDLLLYTQGDPAIIDQDIVNRVPIAATIAKLRAQKK
ncbi:hypothetical protein FACS1894122_00930 [Alphaproteobacteria bacterium]|nr:hypothetical protein FACS1894122_00930 [Alphaproteobacteria bacterium]